MDHRQEEAILRTFGAKLKKIRQERNLSVRQLADLADMNQGNINKLELGKTSPRLPTLIGLAEALQIDPRELLP